MSSLPLDSKLEDLLVHSECVRSLAFQLLVDPHAAEDVVQDTWLEAAQRLPHPLTNARAWLQKVARNRARDRARGESSRALRERIAAREEAVVASDEAAANAEQQRALIGHVLALDEMYGSVLLFHFIEGKSTREIARAQGVPRATVKTRLARALEKLRARLDESSGGDRRVWVSALLPIAGGRAGNHVRRLGRFAPKLNVAAPTALIAVLVGSLWVAARWRLGWPERDRESAARSSLEPLRVVDGSFPVQGASSMGSTDSRRESIVPSNAGTPDAEPEASSQNDKLAQVWQFGEDRFDPNSEGPRAIAIDADGSLFVFEYGKDGRCLVFDRAGNLVAGSISVGWCSEAVRVGTSLFLTVPSGSLVKFDTVSLQPSPALKVADERARWLCNAICSADGIVYVCAGDEGRVQKFDLSLQPRGDWTAPAHLREMDAADGTLYALARESGQSTVHAFSVSGSSLPTAEGDPLVLPANISDLCALSEHRVLLVNESGELLQYKVESAESGITWKLQGRTDLASEGWILSPNTVLRAAYDASAEILYLTFPPPHARVVAVPYSATDARRIRNPR